MVVIQSTWLIGYVSARTLCEAWLPQLSDEGPSRVSRHSHLIGLIRPVRVRHSVRAEQKRNKDEVPKT